jgi:hypothetical protein
MNKRKMDRAGIWYGIKSFFSVQANVLIVVFAVLLLVLTIYPMYSVIRSAVTVGNMDAMMYNSLFSLKECSQKRANPLW